ncbi:MAG: MFS transporter [Paracoccaceae bacterium]
MKAKRRAIWGWMFYDWASQPFHTLILTFIFAPYFAAQVADTPARGQELWGYAVAAGAGVIAILAPVLGAVADASGPRRPWILGFSVAYAFGAAGLWLAAPGTDPLPVLASFVICLIGVEFTTVFTNSLLPALGQRDEIGRISGSGWAMGYWGGLVSLVVVLGFMVPGPDGDATLLGFSPLFGLDAAEGEGARATGPLSALWYVVFMIPFFLWTPDARRPPAAAGAVRAGLRQLGATLKGLLRERSLSAYLLSSMFYRDALNGLYAFGGIYAAGVLGWATFQLGLFGIIAALAGAIGAWTGGRADARAGPKPVIVTSVLALILVSVLTVTTGPDEVLFLKVGSVAAPSALPTIAFYMFGAVIGAAGGALQAASRTMLVRQAAPGRMAEAFGIFALAGKATSFIAPLLIAVATGLTDSQRIGVTPVILLFLAGLCLMTRVSAAGVDDGGGDK